MIHVPAQLCYKLHPHGQFKRILPAGLLVGYQYRCVGCGALHLVLDGWEESVEWTATRWRGVTVEDSDELVEREVRHPVSVRHRGYVCPCGRVMACE